MPGLSGLLLRSDTTIDIASSLQRMLDKQRHRPELKVEKWTAHLFAAGRVHLGIYDTGEVPINFNRYVFWFDGEIYNNIELISRYALPENEWSHKKDAQFIFNLYQKTGGWTFLPQLDGIFAMALFDKETKTVSVISDRLGLRPIYYWFSPHLFAFSAEVKSLVELSGFSKTIDKLAFEEFLAYGHMLNDRTWFEDVKVLEPATIMTVTAVKQTQVQYWSWNDIKSIPELAISVREAANEMGRLFQKAVDNRVTTNHRYSITLSGGRDSRSIFAALPEDKLPIPCLTFGRKGCGDIRFAAMATKERNCPHYITYLDGKGSDWLIQQEWYMWLTDGLADMLSLLGRYMSLKLYTFSDILLNGYMGDSVAGGGYGNADNKTLGEFFGKRFKTTPTGFDGAAYMMEVWQNSNLPLEPFFEYQRARRYILMGSIQHSVYLEQRKPFSSKDFVQFLMGLPESYRRDGLIYENMLLTFYPKLFDKIPRELTGVPIGASRFKQMSGRLWHSAWRIVGRSMPGTLKFVPQYESLAYSTWLRKTPAKFFIREKLLENEHHIYDYLNREVIKQICNEHFTGKANNDRLIRNLLTIETYFQFVFDGRMPAPPTTPNYILIDNHS